MSDFYQVVYKFSAQNGHRSVRFSVPTSKAADTSFRQIYFFELTRKTMKRHRMNNKILITVTLLWGVLRAEDQRALIGGDPPTKMILDRDLRIVGGSAARPAQFPHAAALALLLTTGESFCGGSIIHPIYILTVSELNITSLNGKTK